jgi:hypothetical protein
LKKKEKRRWRDDSDDDEDDFDDDEEDYNVVKKPEGPEPEYCPYGKFNAIHLLFVSGNVVNTNLFNYFIKKDIEVDTKDW